MIDKIKALLKDKEKMRELISYVIFGALTTLISLAVYAAMTAITGMENHPRDSAAYKVLGNVSNVTAWVLAVLFAFFTNKRYVFRSDAVKGTALKEFGKFVSARVLSYALIEFLLYTALLYLMPHTYSKLITTVLVVIFNYAASKWVVFRKEKKAGENE